MLKDFQEQQIKRATRMRSLKDTAVGVLWILIGIFFLVYRYFNINLFRTKPSMLDYLIGGLFILYGGWRIYRGYKKDYFR